MKRSNTPDSRRWLSTPFITTYKIYFAVLTLAVPFYLTVGFWLGWLPSQATIPQYSWQWWLGLLFWVLATAPGWYYARRLKRVQVDDHALYVRGRKSEIVIPLSEVTDVAEGTFWRYFTTLITVRFRSPTTVGSEIEFIPRLRIFWSGSHPVAKDLRALVKQGAPSDVPSLGRLEKVPLEQT